MNIHILSLKGIVNKLLILFVACIFIRLIADTGTNSIIENSLSRIVQSENNIIKILSLELPDNSQTDTGDFFSSLSAILSESPLLCAGSKYISASSSDTDTPVQTEAEQDDEALSLLYTSPALENATENNTVISNGEAQGETNFDAYSLDASSIQLKNNSIYDIDVAALLAEDLNLSIDPSSPQVLIIHTHGSEAYTPDGQDVYVASDPSRTEDCNYNVVRVGNELVEALAERGIASIHDTTLYDYPSYTGSYTRAYESIQSYLEQYPDIKVIIDLHRNALEGSDGTIYKTTAEINGETSAQILLIVGTDSTGLTHPNWRENLKFALHLEASMNTQYPSLARPITISQYRYNQHATTGSLILEVGCNGNTLAEALIAVRCFADSMADVLLSHAQQ